MRSRSPLHPARKSPPPHRPPSPPQPAPPSEAGGEGAPGGVEAGAGLSEQHLSGQLHEVLETWSDFLEEETSVGGRIAAEGFVSGPTWDETAKWALWLFTARCPTLVHSGLPLARAASAASALSSPLSLKGPSSSSFHAAASGSSAGGSVGSATAAEGSVDASVRYHLGIAQSHLFRALYANMRDMGPGEWRLYWTRVYKQYESIFSDRGRRRWMEAAAADARARALRAGLGSARQRECADHASRLVWADLGKLRPRARPNVTATPVHNRW